MPQPKNATNEMGIGETSMPDVVALEVHQNELSGPTFDSLRECARIKHCEWLHGGPQKTTKSGGWALTWDNTVMWHYGNYLILLILVNYVCLEGSISTHFTFSIFTWDCHISLPGE